MNELTHKEIEAAARLLKQFPIDEMWKPKNIDICLVQRVPCDNVVGRTYLMDVWDNGLQTIYAYGPTCVYLQVGREPNTHWLEESGHSYMLWKQ